MSELQKLYDKINEARQKFRLALRKEFPPGTRVRLKGDSFDDGYFYTVVKSRKGEEAGVSCINPGGEKRYFGFDEIEKVNKETMP